MYLGKWSIEAVIAKLLGSRALNLIDVLLMFADSLVYGFPHVCLQVVEPKTGMTFPSTLDEERLLTGTGLRQKSILGLKKITVYAYGQLLNLFVLLSFLGYLESSFDSIRLFHGRWILLTFHRLVFIQYEYLFPLAVRAWR